ncbi:GNAT family N-acetyltransferase [Brucepastera parasyntrophica]|uniref:GNAT family N-acetyltransferase n=1 Tax=Brucepastera parasyntrophica TaxID=2880008 RepID=UPI00210DA381|nr:GNAT family protein [Brucepastera parasyntrophica]ULQ58646.1 GNAT family N-acetyltransferase [Brucepastera parasyntrophica]
MKLTTDRTILFPIDMKITDAILNGTLNELSEYHHNEEWPEKDLQEAFPVFKELLEKNGNDGFNLWLITEKKDNQIIGSAGYIGEPDNDGNIEIGFGIIPSKRGKGFCTEAVKALLTWGLRQDEVACITARCDKSNMVSRRTIIKLGFEYTGDEDNVMNWKIDR